MSYTEKKTKQETYFLTIKSMPMLDRKTKELRAYTLFPTIEPFKEDLQSLQKQVGGYIEHFDISKELYTHHIDMWIDEEGKFKDKKPTFILCDSDGEMVDIIVGNCVFTRFTSSGNTLGLRQKDIEIVGNWLNTLPLVQYEGPDGKGYAYQVKGY